LFDVVLIIFQQKSFSGNKSYDEDDEFLMPDWGESDETELTVQTSINKPVIKLPLQEESNSDYQNTQSLNNSNTFNTPSKNGSIDSSSNMLNTNRAQWSDLSPPLKKQSINQPVRFSNEDLFEPLSDTESNIRKIPGPAGALPPLKHGEKIRNDDELTTNNYQDPALVLGISSQFIRTSEKKIKKVIEDEVDFRQPSWASMLVDMDLPPFGTSKLHQSLWWINTIGFSKKFLG